LNILNIWGKLPSVASTPQIIAAIICFLISAALWMVVMSKRDLSLVYPFIALSHFFIVIMAYSILHEHLGPWRITGIIVIVFGVIILAQDKAAMASCG
jgi:drug/metabolite transporter (DMT)-like permease